MFVKGQKAWNKGEQISLTHGMSYTRFYHIWSQMKCRCKTKRLKDFAVYGAKGIIVEWKTFEEFKFDMYESYLKHCRDFTEKNTSIDRIDGNKNYSKENCRWATSKEQSNNMSRNWMITFDGKTQTLIQWARQLGVHQKTLTYRIKNWGLEKSLSL